MLKNLFINVDNWKSKSLIFLIISILIKLIYFLVCYFLNDTTTLYLYFGDSHEYMESCENLFLNGEYIVNTIYGFKDPTFRMPGFTFVYIPLRFFLNKEFTMDGIIYFQILCSGIASYLLAVLAKNIFNNKMIFYFVFFISNLGLGLNSYNNILLTESLAASFLIFSLYSYERGIKSGHSNFFLTSGFFMTWMVFMRPYMIVLFLFAIVLLFYFQHKKINFKFDLFFFILTFLIIDGCWTLRNYIKTDKFIPLQSSNNFLLSKPKCEQAKFKFITSFGFNFEWWIRNSNGSWFNNPKQVQNLPIPNNKIIPSFVFNENLTIDSLIKARDYMHLVQNRQISNEKIKYYDFHSERIFKKFIEKYKSNRPIDYYVGSRIRLIKSFMSDNHYWQLEKITYPYNLLVIFGDFFSNYLIKIIGFIGLFFVILKYGKSNYLVLLITIIPLFIIGLFPIFYGVDEKRFFLLAIPSLIVSAGYLLTYFLSIKNYYFLIFILLIPFLLATISTIHKINF
jgi:hypothetical protein